MVGARKCVCFSLFRQTTEKSQSRDELPSDALRKGPFPHARDENTVRCCGFTRYNTNRENNEEKRKKNEHIKAYKCSEFIMSRFYCLVLERSLQSDMPTHYIGNLRTPR